MGAPAAAAVTVSDVEPDLPSAEVAVIPKLYVTPAVMVIGGSVNTLDLKPCKYFLLNGQLSPKPACEAIEHVQVYVRLAFFVSSSRDTEASTTSGMSIPTRRDEPPRYPAVTMPCITYTEEFVVDDDSARPPLSSTVTVSITLYSLVAVSEYAGSTNCVGFLLEELYASPLGPIKLHVYWSILDCAQLDNVADPSSCKIFEAFIFSTVGPWMMTFGKLTFEVTAVDAVAVADELRKFVIAAVIWYVVGDKMPPGTLTVFDT
jgi:hypothetical protein